MDGYNSLPVVSEQICQCGAQTFAVTDTFWPFLHQVRGLCWEMNTLGTGSWNCEGIYTLVGCHCWLLRSDLLVNDLPNPG